MQPLLLENELRPDLTEELGNYIPLPAFAVFKEFASLAFLINLWGGILLAVNVATLTVIIYALFS